jgi:hypothetical protein
VAAEVGDQDDAVTEKWDAGAAGHQAFLQLDIGDAAFVDPGQRRLWGVISACRHSDSNTGFLTRSYSDPDTPAAAVEEAEAG